MFEKLKTRFASEELGSGVRMLATVIALINLPGFLMAVVLFMFIIPVPGIFFYIFTVLMALGKVSRPAALFVSVLGVIYDTILLIAVLGNGGIPSDGGPTIVSFFVLTATIGMGGMMIRILMEKNDESTPAPVVEVKEKVVA
jgi:hypothetical protein